MSLENNTQNVGLKLFPPPPKEKRKPSRKPSTRRHAINPQSPPQSAVERVASPEFPTPTDGRQSSLDGRQSALENRQHARDGHQPVTDGQTSALGGRASPITTPSPVAQIGDDQPRSHTSFSMAPTLVRSKSNSSHSSVIKNKSPSTSPQRGEPIMRSIFPRYNPDLPLEHQSYYPTQTSPTHIPRTVISKQPYSPSIDDRSAAGLQSPMAIGISPGRFPRGIQDIPPVLEPSSNEELKELWKVTNGWRVSSSEGRSFCLKLTTSVDEPIYTLSSSTQPFYNLRLDPTSTSAQMTMTRLDPNKPSAAKSKTFSLGGPSKLDSAVEVMSTTLEESVRRLPPNDGLVALLYPRAASNMAIDLASKATRSDDTSILAAAERECGRLVWDEDSQKNYLVHPAVSTPFIVLIKRSPAWSRAEYVLEHPELPHNLVKLVRDGSGGGTLEVDTAVAARIDCFYVVDVAICAVLLVAIADEKTRNVERFEAPPSIAPTSPTPKGKGKKSPKMEEFEMDLESQDSVKEKRVKENLPKPTSCLLSMVWGLFKCLVWTLTIMAKTIATIIIGISKCLTSSKL